MRDEWKKRRKEKRSNPADITYDRYLYSNRQAVIQAQQVIVFLQKPCVFSADSIEIIKHVVLHITYVRLGETEQMTRDGKAAFPFRNL